MFCISRISNNHILFLRRHQGTETTFSLPVIDPLVAKADFVCLCRVCASYPMDRSGVCEEPVFSERRSWQVGLWYHPVGDLLRWRGPPQRQETHRGRGHTQELYMTMYIIIHISKLIFLFQIWWLLFLFIFLLLFSISSVHHHTSMITLCFFMHLLIHMHVFVLGRGRGFTKQSANWPPQTAKSWLNWWRTAWTTTPRRDLSSGLSSET